MAVASGGGSVQLLPGDGEEVGGPHLDKATGLPVRRPKPVRYEHPNPGDLVHVDIKKLGRIPGGGGHRVMSRQQGQANRKKTRPATRSCYSIVSP